MGGLCPLATVQLTLLVLHPISELRCMLAELLERMVDTAAYLNLTRFNRCTNKLRCSVLRRPKHTPANDRVRLVDSNLALGKTGDVSGRLRLVRHAWRST